MRCPCQDKAKTKDALVKESGGVYPPPGKQFVVDLVDVPFPTCSKTCAVVERMGVDECDSMCPWKFEKKNGSLTQDARG